MKTAAVLRLGENFRMAHIRIGNKLIPYFLSNPEAITHEMKIVAVDHGSCPITVSVNLDDQYCKVLE